MQNSKQKRKIHIIQQQDQFLKNIRKRTQRQIHKVFEREQNSDSESELSSMSIESSSAYLSNTVEGYRSPRKRLQEEKDFEDFLKNQEQKIFNFSLKTEIPNSTLIKEKNEKKNFGKYDLKTDEDLVFEGVQLKCLIFENTMTKLNKAFPLKKKF